MAAQSLLSWSIAQHPGDTTKNGAATFNYVFRDWGKTSLVCNINIPDVILPSDAEYLTLWKLSRNSVFSARKVHVSAAY